MSQFSPATIFTTGGAVWSTFDVSKKSGQGRGQLDTGDPFIPKPEKQVASSATLLPVAIKTNTAEGPLCGFTTLFSPKSPPVTI